MGGWFIFAVIVAVIIIALILFMIVTYNRLVLLRNNVKNSFAQIDTQLQRRFDLIPNLVETAKGFATHEKELLEHVTASRSGYMNASSSAEKLALNNELTSNLRTLFAVAENYPDLKANTNFMKLQEEMEESEDKVAYARQFYNDAVTIYNNKLQMFPGNLVAGMFGFEAEALFYSDDAAKVVPKVQF